MANPVNPLDRGRSFDILLASLLDAGVDVPTLAFQLGVNPDTLSAYLLHSSTLGSLHVVPGPDWLNVQDLSLELVPYDFYTITTQQQFNTFQIPAASRWMLYLSSNQTENDFEMHRLILRYSITGEPNLPSLNFQFLANEVAFQVIELPKCTVTALVSGAVGYGSTQLGVSMMRLPVGVF